MNPSQDNLDIVLINKLSYDFESPKEGDVIVFYDIVENEYLIKRVIGLEGDIIQIIEGFIYKNNKLYFDEFSHIDITEGMTWTPQEVGKGQCWVIGDNRDNTWFGTIWNEQIVGKLK